MTITVVEAWDQAASKALYVAIGETTQSRTFYRVQTDSVEAFEKTFGRLCESIAKKDITPVHKFQEAGVLSASVPEPAATKMVGNIDQYGEIFKSPDRDRFSSDDNYHWVHDEGVPEYCPREQSQVRSWGDDLADPDEVLASRCRRGRSQ